MGLDYDRSRLNAEIAEMEARRAAEARARQDALEREQRGPVYRGALTRIREGIKAGREEVRKQREAQKKMYRKYDEQHPSEYGKKVGRVVERAAPTKKVLSRAARATRQMLVASAKAARKFAQESQRRSWDERRARPTRGRRTIRATRDERTTRSKPVRMRSGLDDMTRLDDLMPAPSRPKTQKKKKSRRDDPFDFGGFRLM